MHQCEINALASKHGLKPSKQHRGSDSRGRFFLTQDLAGGVHVHVGLYAQRKIADDGTVPYDDVESAVADVVERFKRLRCH